MCLYTGSLFTFFLVPVQDDDFVARDDFEDADQLRIGNDGIFMLTFFSKNQFIISKVNVSQFSLTLSLTCWCSPSFLRQVVYWYFTICCLIWMNCLPVAFLFNWIGFFLSFCLTTSAAGRYGAISGFGLSLIKWVLIVRVRAIHWMLTVAR